MGDHHERLRAQAEGAAASSSTISSTRGDLDEVVPAADRAEGLFEAGAVAPGITARRASACGLGGGEGRERLGDAVEIGEAADSAAPDGVEERRRIAAGERVIVERLSDAALERVGGDAIFAGGGHAHAAAGVAADQHGNHAIGEGEGGAHGDAAAGVEIGHRDGADAAGEEATRLN